MAQNEKRYTLGLDIGVQSVGWAVIETDPETGDGHIVDLNSYVFDGSESTSPTSKDSKCQEARGYRVGRRQVRRRHHRKEQLKKMFVKKLNVISPDSIDNFYENMVDIVKSKKASLNITDLPSNDLFALRTIALDHKLTKEELFAILLHICSRRGYKDFYDDSEEAKSSRKKEDSRLETAIEDTKLLSEKYRTPGEMFAKDPAFDGKPEYHDFRNVRNHNKKDKDGKKYKRKDFFYIVNRKDVLVEAEEILETQSKFHSFLNDFIEVREWIAIEGCETGKYASTKQIKVNKYILDILFSQRDFEDGPGILPFTKEKALSQSYNEQRSSRFAGFADTISNCIYYNNELRGERSSLIGDLFSTTNLLSQYTYYYKGSGSVLEDNAIKSEVAKRVINAFIKNGKMDDKTLKAILANYRDPKAPTLQIKPTKSDLGSNILTIKKGEKIDGEDTFGKCNKFTHKIKQFLEENGIDWEEFTRDLYDEEGNIVLSTDCKLQRLSSLLAMNITPARREKKLTADNLGLTERVIKSLLKEKFGGTANCSNKYMIEAIEAFMSGEIYGDFQARKNKEKEEELLNIIPEDEIINKVPSIKDADIIRNPAVFRPLNEVRRITNHLLSNYNITQVNIEVASELNQSATAKSKIDTAKRENEKFNGMVRSKIAENVFGRQITDKDMDKYKLYLMQGEKCMYSNKDIILENLFGTESHYEVDHIIPYSLILDDTLENKVLVTKEENARKGQRTALEYLTQDYPQGVDNFKALINSLYISEKNKKGNVKEEKEGNQTQDKKFEEINKRFRPGISKRKLSYLMAPSVHSIPEDWKSRNLNDTRYISKYAVSMFKNLNYIDENTGEIIKMAVTPIKGGITAKFRNAWFDAGTDNKRNSKLELYMDVEKAIVSHQKEEGDITKAVKEFSKYLLYNKIPTTLNDTEKKQAFTEVKDMLMTEYILTDICTQNNIDVSKDKQGVIYDKIKELVFGIREQVEKDTKNTIKTVGDLIKAANTSAKEMAQRLYKYDIEKISENYKNYIISAEYIKLLFDTKMLKTKDREISDLHHAVDAAIIACLDSTTAEIALDANKLYQIYRENKTKVGEYEEYKQSCLNKYKKHKKYIPEYKLNTFLETPGYIPCILSHLKDEILVRTTLDRPEYESLLKELSFELYGCDGLLKLGNDFAESIKPKIKGAKPNRKYRGKITDEQAKQEEKNKKYCKKIIDDKRNIYSLIPADSNYCTEVYLGENENKEKGVYILGVKRIALIKKDGKLWFKPTYEYPKNYVKHIMYLYTNDFIEVYRPKAGKHNGFELQNAGYIRSSTGGYVKTEDGFEIKQQQITMSEINKPVSQNKSATSLDRNGKGKIIKYYVDVLGNKHEVKKESKPIEKLVK